jgi:hypothetical protein
VHNIAISTIFHADRTDVEFTLQLWINNIFNITFSDYRSNPFKYVNALFTCSQWRCQEPGFKFFNLNIKKVILCSIYIALKILYTYSIIVFYPVSCYAIVE